MGVINHKATPGGLFLSFLRLGLTAFGGPAMVAYIKEMSVGGHGWLDEETFKDGVVLCQSVPGSTAMQTAAYVGLRAGGIPGALAAFIGFGLPAFVLIFALSWLYAAYHEVPSVVSVFGGLQVVVVAIVANATLSFGRSTFKAYRDAAFALFAAGLFLAGVSPFLVIAGAALASVALYKSDGITAPGGSKSGGLGAYRLIAIVLAVLACLAALYAMNRGLFELASVMIKVDLFAFGGGFASLPLMLHEVVGVRGWMDSKMFMDGIALGQVTPGPIVMTSAFVGYMVHGAAGAFVATVSVFTPSFLMVITMTPVMDTLKASAIFQRATRGILASFVGLLFFVTIRFAQAVHWDIIRAVLVAAAFAALVRKVDILIIVAAAVAVSVLLL